MTFGTTPKQAELLTFLRDRQNARGAMPSFDEMATAIGLRSKSGISRMVDALVERGAIRRMPNQARSIEVLDLGTAATIDAGTDLALTMYCDKTGLARAAVVTDALREYFRAHPMPGGVR